MLSFELIKTAKENGRMKKKNKRKKINYKKCSLWASQIAFCIMVITFLVVLILLLRR